MTNEQLLTQGINNIILYGKKQGFSTKGIPEGQYSYHYDLKYWELFKDIKKLDKAPEYDGHKPNDVERLLSL